MTNILNKGWQLLTVINLLRFEECYNLIMELSLKRGIIFWILRLCTFDSGHFFAINFSKFILLDRYQLIIKTKRK